jgi:hypothetical protein
VQEGKVDAIANGSVSSHTPNAAATLLPPVAEAMGYAFHQLIDWCTFIDLHAGELQSHSLSCYLCCVERITRK